MGKKDTAEETLATEAKTVAKRKRFVGGDFDLERFGQVTNTETYMQGYVATEDVRAMLDEFGLQARAHVQFPFQHIVKRSGEQWSLRIEQAEPHQVADKHVVAHHWVYKREIPEVTAGSN